MGTTLAQAARSGDLAACRVALADDADSVHAVDHLQRTPLHLAAWAGQLEVCELLLENGARVSASATDDITPLHFAAQNGHVAICKALLKHRARVNARGTKRAEPPLHLAAFKGHLSVVEYLLKKNADATLQNKLGKTASDVAKDPAVKAALTSAQAKSTKKIIGGAGSSAEQEEDVTTQDGANEAIVDAGEAGAEAAANDAVGEAPAAPPLTATEAALEDETLVCRDCSSEFMFTVGEQQFFLDRGWANKKTRCAECQAAKKARFGEGKGKGKGGGRGAGGRGRGGGGKRAAEADGAGAPLSKHARSAGSEATGA